MDEYGADGLTALMRAVREPGDGLPRVRKLIAAGADVNAVCRAPFPAQRNVLALALNGGDPRIVEALLDAGADLHYTRDGAKAWIDAVQGRDLTGDSQLPALLELLLVRGAEVGSVAAAPQSALAVLSRIGRFDAVAMLLRAGADARGLGWNELHCAVAMQPIEQVQACIAAGSALELRDHCQRTAWLIAVQRGEVSLLRLLKQAGANTRVVGPNGEPALLYAVDCRKHEALAYLIEQGDRVDQCDLGGRSPLGEAADIGDVDAVRRLVAAGARVTAERVRSWSGDGPILDSIAEAIATTPRTIGARGALADTDDPFVANWLLAHGASEHDLCVDLRRRWLGLPEVPSPRHLQVARSAYLQHRFRQFGASNPERMNRPFWLDMIRAGVCAYSAADHFADADSAAGQPIWCAERFGQSFTRIADGRIVQIGGEHEDFYDPDFCIYNDVFVHHPDGQIDIYGYPPAEFPPADFHSATLLGGRIVVVGGLGYREQRSYGHTPVFALDLASLRIERLQPTGSAPGWIYSHRAQAVGADRIRVRGGYCLESREGEEHRRMLQGVWLLDLSTLHWIAEADRD